MKQFLGMLLCFAVIVGTVWGLIISFSFLVQRAAMMGVPPELLHFSSGVVVGVWWKEVASGRGGSRHSSSPAKTTAGSYHS